MIIGHIKTGHYISAHVLSNLSNEFGKSDKVRGLLSIISLFLNEFNTFNNTGVRMVDYIYQIPVKLLKHSIFGVKTSRLYHKHATSLWASFYNVTHTQKSVNH